MVHIIHSTLYTLLYLFIIVPKSFQEDSDYSEDNSLIKENGILKVYVCGCCINNGKNTARAGVAVWFNHKHPYNVFKPVSGRATNINAELEASILGIETALKHGFEEVTIHTDSEFVVKCATSWLKRWKENGWKTKNGDDVKNQITLKNLDESINCMKNVFWVHDKASDTEMGYKEAFSLAQKGAKVYALQNNIPEYDTDIIFKNNNNKDNNYKYKNNKNPYNKSFKKRNYNYNYKNNARQNNYNKWYNGGGDKYN